MEGQTSNGGSVASGFQIAAGAIGGIYASTTFQQKQAPKYEGGLWATAVSYYKPETVNEWSDVLKAAQFFMILGAVIMLVNNRLGNRRADKTTGVVEGLEGFRYTY